VEPPDADDCSSEPPPTDVEHPEPLWSAEECPLADTPAPAEDVEERHARDTLGRLGAGGRLLLAMAEDVRLGRGDWTGVFAVRNRRIAILFPSGFDRYLNFGRDGQAPRSAADLLAELERARTLEPAPKGSRFVQKFGDATGVVLRPEYAKALKRIAPVLDAAGQKAEALPEMSGSGISPQDRAIAEQFLEWAREMATHDEGVIRDSGLIRVTLEKIAEFPRSENVSKMRLRSVLASSGWESHQDAYIIYYEEGGDDGPL
jgi:hypothetical protein